MNDNPNDEVYDEYVRKHKSPIKKVTRGLTRGQLIVAILVVALAVYGMTGTVVPVGASWWNTKGRWFTPSEGMVMIAVVAFIIYVLSSKEQKDIITIREARAIMREEIDWETNNSDILPPGVVKFLPVFKLRSSDAEYDRYAMGVEIDTLSGIKKVYMAEVDVHGLFIGLSEWPEGVTGREKSDVKFVEPQYLRLAKRYGWDKYITQPPRGPYP